MTKSPTRSTIAGKDVSNAEIGRNCAILLESMANWVIASLVLAQLQDCNYKVEREVLTVPILGSWKLTMHVCVEALLVV